MVQRFFVTTVSIFMLVAMAAPAHAAFIYTQTSCFSLFGTAKSRCERTNSQSTRTVTNSSNRYIQTNSNSTVLQNRQLRRSENAPADGTTSSGRANLAERRQQALRLRQTRLNQRAERRKVLLQERSQELRRRTDNIHINVISKTEARRRSTASQQRAQTLREKLAKARTQCAQLGVGERAVCLREAREEIR